MRAEILKEHSRSQCNKIVHWIGNTQARFDELMQLFFSGEYLLTQRAAWPLGYCVIAHPTLIDKHLAPLIAFMQKPGVHNAVKRNTLRLLQVVHIPENYEGTIMDLCFSYITNPREKAAVKAFSLTVLSNLARQYPEILPEIRLVIEERWNSETPAFRSRAKKILMDKNLKGKT